MCKDWIESWLYRVATEIGISIVEVKRIADKAKDLEEFRIRIYIASKRDESVTIKNQIGVKK